MEYKQLKEAVLGFEIPDTLKLDDCSTVNNVKHVINTHISYIDANPGRRGFLPYYLRLKKIHDLIAPLQPQF